MLDIGANIGSHTLPLAQMVGPSGRVYSFEPTDYAFGKQRRNLSLNPELSKRVNALQSMLVGSPTQTKPEAGHPFELAAGARGRSGAPSDPLGQIQHARSRADFASGRLGRSGATCEG